jgi:hypothetical protein
MATLSRIVPIVTIAALAVPVAGAGTRPSLQLVSAQPLKVRGAHFRTHERVRVVAAFAEERMTRVVRSTATGGFVVLFSTRLPFDRCSDTLVVTATGARGEEARLKLPQRACPPAP